MLEPDSFAPAVDAVVKRYGRIDILIHCAGISQRGTALKTDLLVDRHLINVNYLGPVALTKEVLPYMIAAGRGHIVVVSSAAALRGFPWTAVYAATKAAQKTFAETLRHELSGTGVSLTTVMPGSVTTDLHSHEGEKMPDWWRRGEKIEPSVVADAILEGVAKDRREVFVPGNIRLLALSDAAPGLMDRLMVLMRGGSAAPRRY
jgi:short-subunit dehydrogenase